MEHRTGAPVVEDGGIGNRENTVGKGGFDKKTHHTRPERDTEGDANKFNCVFPAYQSQFCSSNILT